jgi:hypothetical protein
MADLSWAREAGAARRAALDRDVAHDAHDAVAAARLVGAMFDGHIKPFWRRLSICVQETVEAYNTAGQFSDLSFTATPERIVIERPQEPSFFIELQLDRTNRAIQLMSRDGDGALAADRLGLAFVDGDLALVHEGQIENGYQLAKRLLKTRL